MSFVKDPSKLLASSWKNLSKVPGGKTIFSKIVGNFAPYTGTLGAVVEELSPGKAVIKLHERWRIKNHLNSIHAVALMNLGEMATGLPLVMGLGSKYRAILIKFQIEYYAKARGTVTAESMFDIPKPKQKTEFEIVSVIKNEKKEIVAKVFATWLVDLQKS